MKTVFIVTEGDYSDYHITGVFTTKELAQNFIDAGCGDNIEEFKVNPYKVSLAKGYKPFFVRIGKGGDVKEIYDGSGYISHGFDVKGGFYTTLFAKDEIHAAKIANERRTQILAQDCWGKDLSHFDFF